MKNIFEKSRTAVHPTLTAARFAYVAELIVRSIEKSKMVAIDSIKNPAILENSQASPTMGFINTVPRPSATQSMSVPPAFFNVFHQDSPSPTVGVISIHVSEGAFALLHAAMVEKQLAVFVVLIQKLPPGPAGMGAVAVIAAIATPTGNRTCN